jgi:hypothetical protein
MTGMNTSTIDSLKRASAACHAATDFTPAKRGMFALVERRHSYTSLLHGAYAGYIGYTPAIVSSVDRAGIVKEVRVVSVGYDRLKRRDWQFCHVDSAGKIADPEAVVAALVDTQGRAIEYHDRNEAIAAIKAAAGLPL